MQRILTFKRTSHEWIAHIIGETGTDGTMVQGPAFSIESADTRTRVNTLVPEIYYCRVAAL